MTRRYYIQRLLFQRRRRWSPFGVLRRLGVALIVFAAACLVWRVRGDGSTLVARFPLATYLRLGPVNREGTKTVVFLWTKNPTLSGRWVSVSLENGSSRPLWPNAPVTEVLCWSFDGRSLLCQIDDMGGSRLQWRDLSGGHVDVPSLPGENPAGSRRLSLSTYIHRKGADLLYLETDRYGSTRFLWWLRAGARRWEGLPTLSRLKTASSRSPGFAPSGDRIALDWTLLLPSKQRVRRLYIGYPGASWHTHRLPDDTDQVYWSTDETLALLRGRQIEIISPGHNRRRKVVGTRLLQPDVVKPSPKGYFLAVGSQVGFSPEVLDPAGPTSPLLVIDRDGRTLRILEGTNGSCQWSPDGRTLFFARRGELRSLRL